MDQNIEALTDLLEVIYATAQARGYTLADLEQVRAEKAAKCGGFEKKILLKEVSETMSNNLSLGAILSNRKDIFNRIDLKTLMTYCWLEENLHKRNVYTDSEYRKKFSGYYRMRFVTPQYKDAFFALFEQIKTRPDISFEEVSRQLYIVDGKHEFSFISKMLHTINPTRPIYDSQVDSALSIHRSYQPDFNKRLQLDVDILNGITEQYQELLGESEISEILVCFDQIAPSCKMSTEKKLDFILWALG